MVSEVDGTGVPGDQVSCTAPYEWVGQEWQLGGGFAEQRAPRRHVVVYDFGVKANILRMLASRGCRVTVLPAKSSAADALALKPDGVFLSNGPGDPQPCDYAIAAARELTPCRTSITDK